MPARGRRAGQRVPPQKLPSQAPWARGRGTLLACSSSSRADSVQGNWLCETARVSPKGSLDGSWSYVCRPRRHLSLVCSVDRTRVDFRRFPGPSWSHRWSKMVPPCRPSYVPGSPSVACPRRSEPMSRLPTCTLAEGCFQLKSGRSAVRSRPWPLPDLRKRSSDDHLRIGAVSFVVSFAGPESAANVSIAAGQRLSSCRSSAPKADGSTCTGVHRRL